MSMSPSSWRSSAPSKLFDCAYRQRAAPFRRQANQAVFCALLQPGDTFMGLDLAAGGHLTHGRRANYSGKWFKPVPYGVRRKDDQRIDIGPGRRAGARAQAEADHRRRLRLCRASSTSRASARSPTRSAPIFMVDMAHFAGLVAARRPSQPAAACPCRDHHHPQDLRGPRGGMILSQRRGDRQEDQLRGLPRPAGRPADACHRRQGGGLRRSAAAGVQDLRARRGRQCPGAGRDADRTAAWTSSPAAPTAI